MNQSLKGPEGLRLYKATSKLRVHDSYTKSDIKYKTSGTKSPIMNCRTGGRTDHKSRIPIYTKVRYWVVGQAKQ